MSCFHIYEYVGQELCPQCGKTTHEIDWAKENAAHDEFIESGQAVAQGWWSI